MSVENHDDLIKEFLKNNEIEIIPPIEEKRSGVTVSGVKHNIADMMSLGESINMYGEKQKRKVKKKKPDISKINKDLIPESLHGIINLYSNEESKEDK